MRLLRSLSILCVLVVLFILCLLFVVSNPESVTLDLLISGWQFHSTLGVLILLTLVIGVLIGWLLYRAHLWVAPHSRGRDE